MHTDDFATDFSMAMKRLRQETNRELVRIAELRRVLCLYGPSEFDQEILKLRLARKVILHTGEGRHLVVSIQELQDAVVEPGTGRRFVFATHPQQDPGFES